jgi:hypothetical protein
VVIQAFLMRALYNRPSTAWQGSGWITCGEDPAPVPESSYDNIDYRQMACQPRCPWWPDTYCGAQTLLAPSGLVGVGMGAIFGGVIGVMAGGQRGTMSIELSQLGA